MPHPLSCILLLSVASCSPQQQSATTTSQRPSSVEAEDTLSALAGIDTARAQFLAAYTRRDLEGVMRAYADDIRFIFEGRVLDGKEAVREAWSRSLPTLSGLRFKPVSSAVSGDVGVLLESFTQRFAEPGRPEQTDSGYSLSVLRRQPNGRWHYQTVALSRPPEKPAETARERPRSR